MKTVIAILCVFAAALHSSGWKPGAVTRTSIAIAKQDADHAPACSGFPPGAMTVSTAPTFTTIDITIDPLGEPLAAYQFELTSDDVSFTVVGVEGGASEGAFDHGRPPYFDPVVTQGQTDRLILAEYAKPALTADQLPTESVRVATVHVMFAGPIDEQTIQFKLTTAGNADGQRIDANLSHSIRTPDSPERPQ